MTAVTAKSHIPLKSSPTSIPPPSPPDFDGAWNRAIYKTNQGTSSLLERKAVTTDSIRRIAESAGPGEPGHAECKPPNHALAEVRADFRWIVYAQSLARGAFEDADLSEITPAAMLSRLDRTAMMWHQTVAVAGAIGTPEEEHPCTKKSTHRCMICRQRRSFFS